MRLLGIGPVAFALGLIGLLAGLLVLHLLRVRLRRTRVDTLLFFRVAGETLRPRTLLGRPSRWLAYALGALLLGALWLAFADPRTGSDARSRAVVVAGDLPRAVELAQGGLGPRGVVVAAMPEPRILWRAGEATALLAARGAGIVAQPAGEALAAALRLAGDSLRAGDEIALVGAAGDAPTAVAGLPVVVVAPAKAVTGFTSVTLREEATRKLECEAVAPAGAKFELRLGTRVVGEAAAPRAQLALPDEAGGYELRLVGGSVLAAIPIALAARAPIAVALEAGLPEAVGLAVAADPVFRVAEAGALHVGRANPRQAVPTLLLAIGGGSAPRAPRVTAQCPLPLAMTDREREGAALEPVAGESVWVEDANSGAPLVASDGQRVRVVEWLLDEAAHRDVPVLLAGALRWLAGLPRVMVVPVGEPVAVALAAGVHRVGGEAATALLAAAATTPFAPPAPATYALGTRQVVAFTPGIAAADAPAPAPAPELASLGGVTRWLPWLLGLALVLLALDLFLFARGRWP